MAENKESGRESARIIKPGWNKGRSKGNIPPVKVNSCSFQMDKPLKNFIIIASIFLLNGCSFFDVNATPSPVIAPTSSPTKTPVRTSVFPPTFTPTLAYTFEPTFTKTPTITSSPTNTATTSPTTASNIIAMKQSDLSELGYDIHYMIGVQAYILHHDSGVTETIPNAADSSRWQYLYGGEDAKVYDLQGNILRRTSEFGWGKLEIIDPNTQEINLLRSFEHGYGKFVFGDLTISPDKNLLAYALQYLTEDGGRKNGVIEIISAHIPNQVIQSIPYECNDGDCRERLLWSPNSQSIAWVDDIGVWVTNIEKSTKLLLAQTPYEENNPTAVHVYTPLKWSPSGRYLLVQSSRYEWGSEGVVDTQSGHYEDLPYTSQGFDAPHYESSWAMDDRLLVVISGYLYGENSYPPQGHLWHIEPENTPILVEEAHFTLSEVSSSYMPIAPQQIPDGDFVFGILPNESIVYGYGEDFLPWQGGMYLWKWANNQVSRLTELPSLPSDWYGARLVWAPDGSGAFFEHYGSHLLLYIPANGESFYDLYPLLGKDACCVGWYP